MDITVELSIHRNFNETYRPDIIVRIDEGHRVKTYGIVIPAEGRELENAESAMEYGRRIVQEHMTKKNGSEIEYLLEEKEYIP